MSLIKTDANECPGRESGSDQGPLLEDRVDQRAEKLASHREDEYHQLTLGSEKPPGVRKTEREAASRDELSEELTPQTE